jgi:hypothetical protein
MQMEKARKTHMGEVIGKLYYFKHDFVYSAFQEREL